MHYKRWLRHGDPFDVLANRGNPDGAFSSRVAWDGEHLIWIGYASPLGYGRMTVEGRGVLAHRFSWERERGPIPAGMFIDHACHVPACVLPEHLRVANRAENGRNRRGPVPGRLYDLPRGVTVLPGGSFRAKVGGVHVGVYSGPEEASAAATAKRAELFGEFAGAA